MAQINTTGNADIDEATAEIAVALRNACPVTCGEQDHYHEAMRLRDAIMKGTRELDENASHDWTPCKFSHGSDEAERERILAAVLVDADEATDDRNLREHTAGSDREHFQGRQDDSFMGPAL